MFVYEGVVFSLQLYCHAAAFCMSTSVGYRDWKREGRKREKSFRYVQHSVAGLTYTCSSNDFFVAVRISPGFDSEVM